MASYQTASATIDSLSPDLSAGCSLAALVIAKQDPKLFPSKRDPSTMTSVLGFTLRDSPDDIINVSSWGSQRHVAVQAGSFHVGDVVFVQNPQVSVRQPTDTEDNYRPASSSPFTLKLSESASSVCLYVGDASQFRRLAVDLPLLSSTLKPLSSVVTSPSGEPVICSLLVALRKVCSVRDVTTKQGRQTQSCELRVIDQSCDSFGFQLWDAEWIRMAQTWRPWETVLLIADCRVRFDAYRQTAVGSATSQTVIVPEPNHPAARILAQYAAKVRAQYTENETSDQFDVSSVRETCTVSELVERTCEMSDVFGTHQTVIVPAFITRLPLSADLRYKVTKCGQCFRYVPDSESRCNSQECSGWSGQLLQEYSLRLDVADHTGGVQGLLLEGKIAEQALQVKLHEFESMSELEQTKLRQSWMMEYTKIWVRYQMRLNGKPFFKILQLQHMS